MRHHLDQYILLSYWLTVVTFGLCLVMGFTLLFMGLTTVVMQWFPNRKGLVFGIVSSGTCLSSSLFVPLQTVFINPNNLIPDFRPETNSEFYYFSQSEVPDRVPYSFLLLGVICIILQFIGVAVMVDPENIAAARKERSCMKSNFLSALVYACLP